MVTSVTPSRRQELPRLTAFRWYAALLVFCFHVNQSGIDWRPMHLAGFGQVGVSFFFVLSGFVLTWSTRKGQRAREFYSRRFARIYPGMAVMLLVAVVLGTAWSRRGIATGPLGLAACVFVVQAWFPGNYPVYAYNPVAWSLSSEAFFYALWPWLVRPLRACSALVQVLIAVLALGGAAAASLVLVRHGHGADIAFNNPLIRSAEFVFGMVLALRAQSAARWPRVPVSLAALVILAAAVVARHASSIPAEDYIMVLPFALLLVAGAQADLRGVDVWLTSRLSGYLGRVSFCFYLVHYLVILTLTQALHWQHHWSTAAGALVVVAIFVVSLLLAMSLHHAVEVPWERRLRTRMAPRRAGAHRAAADRLVPGLVPGHREPSPATVGEARAG